jgi:hypothetical protein
VVGCPCAWEAYAEKNRTSLAGGVRFFASGAYSLTSVLIHVNTRRASASDCRQS